MVPDRLVNRISSAMKGDRVFEGTRNKEDFYLRLSTIAGDKMKGKENTLVFLDEIQAYPEMLTLLKFLKQDDRFTYIVSGSQLGIALEQTLSKPGDELQVSADVPKYNRIRQIQVAC